MKKKYVTLIILVLFAAFLLSSCGSPKYKSDFIIEDSYRNHVSPKAQLSGESYLAIDSHKGDKVIPMWEVAEIDIYLQYDEKNDHVDIVELYAYDSSGEKCSVKEYTCDDIWIEWWPLDEDYVWVENVFFEGQEGYYGFHVYREVPIV